MLDHTAQDITSNQVARIPAELPSRMARAGVTRDRSRRHTRSRRAAGISVPVPTIDARLLPSSPRRRSAAPRTVRITPPRGPPELKKRRPARPPRDAGTIDHASRSPSAGRRACWCLRLSPSATSSSLHGSAPRPRSSARSRSADELRAQGFRPTGRSAAYTKPQRRAHVLWHDFRHADMVENEMFRRLYLGEGFPQVVRPSSVPSLGLAVSEATFRLAACG